MKCGVKPGILGETVFYPDTGCDKAKERGYFGPCLIKRKPACPFKRCLEDGREKIIKKVKTKEEREIRNAEIRKGQAEGMSLENLHKKFKLSKMRIWQVLND